MYILSALSAICPQLANRVQKCAPVNAMYLLYRVDFLEFCRRPNSVHFVQKEGERRAAIEQLPGFG